MKLQTITLFSFIAVVFFTIGCKDKKALLNGQLDGFDSTNTELRIGLIYEHLLDLQNSKDSIFYKKREQAFNLLLEEDNLTVEYLSDYVVRLEGDFIARKNLPPFFTKQILFLKEECKAKHYDKLLPHIIEFEELLLSKLKSKDAFSFGGIDRMVCAITPFKSDLKLGDIFEAKAGVFAYNVDGNRWFSSTDIYHVEKDTILILSYRDTLGNKSGYQSIEFQPTKRGRYIAKGYASIFVNNDNKYINLDFETEFTVK